MPACLASGVTRIFTVKEKFPMNLIDIRDTQVIVEMEALPDCVLHEYNEHCFQCAYKDVMDFVEKELEGDWECPDDWTNVVDGEFVCKPNPHQNERGNWVWKVVKA